MDKKLNFNKYLIIFTILFSTGMYLSKTVQPIYFNENQALKAFGFSYSAMAIAGMLSFLWGKFVDKIGWNIAITLGCLIYSCALIGRIFLSPYISTIVGFLAGMGASIALLSIRSWIVQFNSDINLEKISSVKNIGNQIGIFTAILFSFVFISIPFFKNNANIILLLISIIPIISALIVIKIFNKLYNNKIYINKPNKVKVIEKKITKIIIIFIMISFISGLYISFISPYTSIILIKYGIQKNYAIAFLLIIASVQILTSIIYLKVFSFNIIFTYVLSEIFILIITFLILISLNYNLTILLILSFISRAVILTISAITEESIHYKYLSSQKNTGYVFGLLQTSFLFGDSLGGLFATFIIDYISIYSLFYYSLLIIGINIITIIILINRLKVYTI